MLLLFVCGPPPPWDGEFMSTSADLSSARLYLKCLAQYLDRVGHHLFSYRLSKIKFPFIGNQYLGIQGSCPEII